MAYEEKINAEVIPEGFEVRPHFAALDTEMKVAVMSGIKGDKGDKGDTGATGNGIADVEMNSDYTLTITLDDGTEYTTDPIRGAKGEQGEQGEPGQDGQDGQDGEDGRGIVSITKTGSATVSGRVVDTYTITYTDSTTSTYTVTNGKDGEGGGGGSVDAFDINFVGDENAWTCDQTYDDILDAINDGKLVRAYVQTEDLVISVASIIVDNGCLVFVYNSLPKQFDHIILNDDDTTVYGSVTIPSNTSDLINDSGYITGYTETDPVFTASAAAGISSSDISNWNGKAETSDIPTNVSELINDSGYITDTGIMQVAFTNNNGTIICNRTFADLVNAIGDGYIFDVRYEYNNEVYKMSSYWDDNRGTSYIKFITADAQYVITYTSTSITLDTNAVSSAFDVIISVESGTLSCNVTMLDIVGAVWDGKTLNAVYSSSLSEQVSLSCYCYADENNGYCDFYGVFAYGYLIHIKYSIANGLEWVDAPYPIYNLYADGAYADGNGNNIASTYATKSEIPTNVSDLTNDSGFTTNTGTVTSVRVQATSPVNSSTSTAQSSTLNTTISLDNGYGDTKNPYASKTKNYVLAAPAGSNGTPSFRALDKSDLPTLTASDVGALPSSTSIPTKTSDLTNDSGFITSETDPTVPSWAKASSKPSYTASEVGALPDTTVIPTVPTTVSSFTNDAGYVIGVGSSKIFVQSTAPVGASDGDIWVDTSQTAIPSANGESF